MELTEEQQDFLSSCEEQFANRFSEHDESFMDLKKKPLSCPPIVDPWDNHSHRDRYSRGGNRNHYNGRGGRDGRDQRHWRDDRGSGYSRRYEDRNDSSRNQDRNYRRPHPYNHRGGYHP